MTVMVCIPIFVFIGLINQLTDGPGRANSSSIQSNTIENSIKAPAGYIRIDYPDNKFGEYLRKLPVKAAGSPVKLYNGNHKLNQNAHFAVVDIEIGKKDLQQCADAVIRLRAEYLYSQGKLDSISFHLTNGFRVDFNEWAKGNRVVVEGNKTYWAKTKTPASDYKTFREYLDFVFTYAGSLSLAKELKFRDIKNIQIGDVFIQGGSPGHAVIVVDIAVNPTTKEKIFLLAQSFMPAQDVHILINPSDSKLNPWYSVNFGDTLKTPEWLFYRNDLKRF